ncbi:MAG: CoA-acylating methylmalonate-semialdehyde dehydrogenase [Nitriliruptorales bacterium]|nr:CoA-acylating methylmalonate-semialdehyde dehydrogenase [Nitriliruptorales bacterium]
MRHITHWIDGTTWTGESGGTSPVFDPSTGEQQAAVTLGDRRAVDAAVGAARDAFPAWAAASLSKRTRILFAFRDLVERHADELAGLVTSEHGKVISDAGGEVQRGLEVAEFACGVPHLLKGSFSEQVSTGIDSYDMRQPVGVCAGITPFNFPVMVPMWMHPVAIACGNTFVLKPSERDPSASVRIAELWADAGLPPGVFNVVHGDRAAVDLLLRHPGIDAVSFVGSTPVAKHIYESAASAGKRVQALGGAKNHMVVLPDADIETAAEAAIGAGYGSAGERCMAISVVVAVGAAGDDLVRAIRQRLSGFRIGPGLKADSEMGPLVTQAHRERVAGYVERGVAEGAELVVDGRDLSIEGHESGFWLGPCLFDRATPDMTIYTDEIFGPVLSVVRVNSFDDAVTLVNDNPYGNGVAVFTNDGGASRRFASDIQVGMVGINVPIPVPMAYYSFGGWKDSLFGSHAVHGMQGVGFYTRTKTVTARWPLPEERKGVDLGFPVQT